ncbi:hypothetical protein JXM83_07395 [Candidatus Woesearchaeota archaeon]|nr:hypothetical protein [Candidatus Woesearchaeota archaeon]
MGQHVFFDGQDLGESENLERKVCDNSTFCKKQLGVLKDEDIFYENDEVDGYLEKHKLSFDDFLSVFSPLLRQAYCVFGCPSRQDCASRVLNSNWNFYEAFSKDYVLENFPTNPSAGAPILTVDDLLVNAIELYISSRDEFVKSQEKHLGVFSSEDSRQELLEVQQKALKHYEHIFRKIVRTMVVENPEKYDPDLASRTLQFYR